MTKGLIYTLLRFILPFCFDVVAEFIAPSSQTSVDIPLAFNFSQSAECDDSDHKLPSPAVPKLSEAFSLKMEIKLDAKHYMDWDEYYEKDGQRGASFVMAGGTPTTYLYDFVSGKAFSIEGENRRTCQAQDLWELECNTYGYFMAELAGHSNILSNCNLTVGKLTYFGHVVTTVRGIEVDMWMQCVHDHRSNFTSVNKYYFTKPGIISPSGFELSPVRLEIKYSDGPKAEEVLVYDFTSYIPEVKDRSVFLPGRGVYCPGWARANKTMPPLPDKFSLSMTTLAKNEKHVYHLQLNFDYKHGLVAFATDTPNGTRFTPSRSKHRTLTRVVHDYANGFSFTMPKSTLLVGGKECYVAADDNTATDHASNKIKEVHMMHAWELFGMSGTNWVYVGERDYNGLPAYVWNSQRNSTMGAASVMVTTEVYWLHENWTTTGSPDLIGLDVYRNFENGTVIEIFHSAIDDFSTSSSSMNNWRVFNVAGCLKNGNEKVITFCLKVQNYTEIGGMTSFETGLRDTLATMSGASLLRFTDLLLTKGDAENEAHVWVTVLRWINQTWNVDPHKSSSADQVVDTLRSQFGQKDYDTQIFYGNKSQMVTFLKNTILIKSELLRPTTSNPITSRATTSIIQEGYTSGSMAALGLTMIIIGLVAGIVAGFLLWKRSTGIAYEQHD